MFFSIKPNKIKIHIKPVTMHLPIIVSNIDHRGIRAGGGRLTGGGGMSLCPQASV